MTEQQQQEDNGKSAKALFLRCLSAESPKEQESAFQDLASHAKRDETSIAVKENICRRILLECPYGQLGSLMDQVIDSCGIVVAVANCISILKELTVASSSEVSKKLPPPSIVNACWVTIRRFFLLSPTKNDNDTTTITTKISFPTQQQETKELVKTILLFPQIIANACHSIRVSTPLGATPAKMYPRLVECALSKHNNGDDTNYCHFFETLIHSMLASRKSEYVAIGLAGHHPCSTALVTNLQLSPRESATLLLAMLLHFVSTTTECDDSNPAAVLQTCNAIAKQSSYEDREVWVQLLILSPSDQHPQKDMMRLAPLIINHLLDQGEDSNSDGNDDDDDDDDDDNGGLYQHLCDIAETWSQWTYCQEVSKEKQNYVTQILLLGLDRLLEEKKKHKTGETLAVVVDNDDDDLTFALMQGVTHRLESFQPSIRKDGMKIAQKIAKRLGQCIHFEELDEEEEEKEKESQQPPKLENSSNANNNKEGENAADSVKEPSPEAKVIAPRTKKKKKVKRVQMDPDADYDSDYEEEEDEVSETDNSDDGLPDDDSTIWDENGADELVPYDLNDDEEDLAETPVPLHLLECLELLRTPETHDHAYSRHETALKCLSSLIRKRPDDLPDVAISLGRELLRMENKFNMDGFAIMKHESLVALTVAQPLAVGQNLIDELFQDWASSDRLNMLAALQEAAYELSGIKALDEKRLLEAKQKMVLDSSSKKGGEAELDTLSSLPQSQPQQTTTSTIVRNRLLNTKTRRKRSARSQQQQQKPQIISNNNFVRIAPIWFYALIAGFLQHKEKDALWSGSTGTQLLSQLLQTLATIVEFSGIQSAPVLAKDLFELAWPFHNADVAEVRVAVLVSVATAVMALPGDGIVQLVLSSSSSQAAASAAGGALPQIIADMSSSDPNTECRSLAKTISSSIVEVLDQTLITG